MSVELDWQVRDEGEGPDVTRLPAPRRPLWSLLTVAAVVGAVLVVWMVNQRWVGREEAALRAAAQNVLDLERQAVLAADVEVYLALQVDDPAWVAEQLRPERRSLARQEVEVTRAEQHGLDVWANVTWTVAGQTWQRVAFLQWDGDSLRHAPAPAGYWGIERRTQHSWGTLVTYEVDQEWVGLVAKFVAEVVAETCRIECAEGRLPLTLTLAADDGLTAAPNHLRLPSPRLVALDGDRQPGSLFWERLRQALENYLTPALIRFAAPENLVSRYGDVADEFMAQHPDITVQVVSLATLPPQPAEMLAMPWLDGAVLAPTESLVVSGLVRDLTELARTDPEFDQGDFYEQLWLGAWWRERMWIMPQAARMPLIYYDRDGYRRAGRPEPAGAWTWSMMAEDATAIVEAEAGDGLVWGFLDPGREALFSYAYGWGFECNEAVVIRCARPLQPAQVTAALEWYREMAARPEMTPDLTGLSAEARDHQVLNLIAPRRVAIWVDEPVNYEFHLLRQPLGLAPFPGVKASPGIVPLWVQGSVISQQSERPEAVWQWIKFLTYRTLGREERLIPARPSVAVATDYWFRLPEPLGEVMRGAFAQARPVLIEETGYFSWEQLAAVASGEVTAVEAGQMGRPGLVWP